MKRVVAVMLISMFGLAACYWPFSKEGRLAKGKITVKWYYPPKPQVFGFRVFRADRQEGPYVEITREPIPVIDPRSGKEPKYTFTDKNAILGQAYFYSIEAVDVVGKRNVRIQPLIRVVAQKGKGAVVQ